MKSLFSILSVLALVTGGAAGELKLEAEDVFREPFTLKLYVDGEHFYEKKIGKIPYVHDGVVFLFKDDEFGLALDVQGDSIKGISYQKDLTKADVTLKFTQEVAADKTAMMMLHIHNNTKYTLDVGALMTIPGRKEIAETSILPVRPGLSGFESWPHLIFQLALRNIRIHQ